MYKGEPSLQLPNLTGLLFRLSRGPNVKSAGPRTGCPADGLPHHTAAPPEAGQGLSVVISS